MKNRTIPYGYKIQNGKISINESEVEIIQRIFNLYIGGMSLFQVSEKMQNDKIEYIDRMVKWNKNIIKRIVENKKYRGDNIFNRIISDELFIQANRIMSERNTKKSSVDKTEKQISKRFIYENGSKVSYQKIIDSVINIMNKVIKNPELLNIEIVNPVFEPNEKINRINNEINRLLDLSSSDKETVKHLILQCAEEKYNLIQYNDEFYRTEELKRIFSDTKFLTTLNIDLFEKTVKSVNVGTEYISVTFKNRAVIEERG